ncbi:MAG: hypothetical protein Q9208_000826 [Pyrenodesmia sp. 3 TL-2023]
MFEFSAFLFLARVFPGTLLYASIYALARSFAVLLLSSWVGGLMDISDRLSSIRISIVLQRFPVATSCVMFITLFAIENTRFSSIVFFVVLVPLACVEKVAASANTIAVERDWVSVVIVCQGDEDRRRDLNASMRRIDLVAKLIAPLLISFIDAASTTFAVWTVLGSTLASVVVEYIAIAQVYHTVPQLAEIAKPSGSPRQFMEPMDVEESEAVEQSPGHSLLHAWLDPILSIWSHYFRSPMLLASLSLSILFLTVLSFNAHMVTYLLALGFSALWVAVFRLISVIVELGATWAAPFLMSKIGPVRSGLWFITWQFVFAAAGVAIFNMQKLNARLNAIPLVVGVVLSRIGLWGFDLSVQYLIQEVRVRHA